MRRLIGKVANPLSLL
jgi:hypothetical protein